MRDVPKFPADPQLTKSRLQDLKRILEPKKTETTVSPLVSFLRRVLRMA